MTTRITKASVPSSTRVRAFHCERHASDPKLLDSLQDERTVRRLAWFSKGFYSVRMANRDLRVADGAPGTFSQLLGAVTTAQAAPVGSVDATRPIVMTDLRMGQTPWFVFSFVVAERGAKGITCRAEPSDCECAPSGHGTALVVEQDLGRGRDVLNRKVRASCLRRWRGLTPAQCV